MKDCVTSLLSSQRLPCSARGQGKRGSRWIPASAGMTIFLVFALFGCVEKKTTTWEYMPNMVNSPAVKAQEEPMRVPPKGTLSIGFGSYPLEEDQRMLAGQMFNNPLPRTKPVLLRGKFVYDNTCLTCHGKTGKGDGPVVPKFPRPPSLVSDKVIQWKDGEIFHVITKGQNLMSSHATQVQVNDRWATAHYIRALQRASKPQQGDVEAYRKALKEKRFP